MFLLDQPEMEPARTDARILHVAPGSTDLRVTRIDAADTRWKTARVVVGFVSATVLFQVILGHLVSWWLDL